MAAAKHEFPPSSLVSLLIPWTKSGKNWTRNFQNRHNDAFSIEVDGRRRRGCRCRRRRRVRTTWFPSEKSYDYLLSILCVSCNTYYIVQFLHNGMDFTNRLRLLEILIFFLNLIRMGISYDFWIFDIWSNLLRSDSSSIYIKSR